MLLPVYGREVTSSAPWCPRWWEHLEAVAQLHGLWLAWAELTSPAAGMAGPASWHRDFLAPVMGTLRDPMGPFAGCKLGGHRPEGHPAGGHRRAVRPAARGLTPIPAPESETTPVPVPAPAPEMASAPSRLRLGAGPGLGAEAGLRTGAGSLPVPVPEPGPVPDRFTPSGSATGGRPCRCIRRW